MIIAYSAMLEPGSVDAAKKVGFDKCTDQRMTPQVFEKMVGEYIAPFVQREVDSSVNDL